MEPSSLSPFESLETGPATEQPTAEHPTTQIVTAAVADRCASCGTPMAADQRYCVNCGERRGKPRFPIPGSAAAPAPVPVPGSGLPPMPPRSRFTATGAFLGGIAVLLIAMGVGVLIGNVSNSGSSSSAKVPAVTVVRVGGGGNASGSTGSSGNSGTTGSTGGKRGKKSKTATASAGGGAAKAPTKVVIQKAAAASTKVLGAGAHVAAPTTKVGDSCQNGTPGCSNGHFTGSFFH